MEKLYREIMFLKVDVMILCIRYYKVRKPLKNGLLMFLSVG